MWRAGWADAQRLSNLQGVVNNARFLILPWVRSKGLASKVLAMAARRLPQDWQQRYGYRPVLLETFVQIDRHLGTCYKAANWVHLGQTVGRGKKAPTHKQILPIKDVWIYPLRRDYVGVLTRVGSVCAPAALGRSYDGITEYLRTSVTSKRSSNDTLTPSRVRPCRAPKKKAGRRPAFSIPCPV